MTAGADPCDITLRSYSDAIDRYIAGTEWPSAALTRYLDRIAEVVGSGHILELGSGPGWDADYLEARGARVSRTDASVAFVDRLRRHGHCARVVDARRDDLGGPYDAVYANAVMLHLSAAQVDSVLRRAWHAVVPGGLLAVTLKDGDGSAWSTAKLDRPRHFTYWREPALRAALGSTGWTDINLEHVDGPNDPWLYALAQRGIAPPTPR
jgi:trans-aconitate methyltransferase